jgi:ectoine hydroxylase-related dioxygenase (phytanoyl-CoA dioxygenase family)
MSESKESVEAMWAGSLKEAVGRLHTDGFAVLPQGFDVETTQRLAETLNRTVESNAVRRRSGEVFAIRHLCKVVPEVLDFAQSPALKALIGPILGPDFRLVRSILFDKVHGANWKVTWHQDLTITVRERKEAPGFVCWTQKTGVTHVQPPSEILESILTVRIHLDLTDGSNGALKVIPGSHRHGRLSADQIKARKEKGPTVRCDIPAGGVMLMRPLLLHASSPAATPHRRRVLHLEYSATQLPDGLEWYGS